MKLIKGLCLLLTLCTTGTAIAQTGWQEKLKQEIPELGDRNWIAIVDSAYPLQVAPGIETIDTGTDEVTVVKEVLSDLADAPHVRPVIYMDAELPYVSERDAPGVTIYRNEIRNVMANLKVYSQLHTKTIAQLNSVGKEFRVVILKTSLKVPYSSVFILLKCGYWSDAAEGRLRRSMKNDDKIAH